MRSIDSQIDSGDFRRIYLLFGKEHYLLKKNRKRLLTALGVTDRSDMNFTRLTERDFSVPVLISDSDTLPFFADRRVILVEESGFFKGNKKDKDTLVSYIPQIPESTVIVFVESEVDKRDRLYKAVSKNGTAEEFLLPGEGELAGWIGKRLKDDGMSMRHEAWNEFFIRCGSSMDLMDEEYSKLSAYCWERKQIEKSDVEAVCVNSSETRVFALTDAIADRDASRIFRVYGDMLRQNEPAPMILSLIERQLMQLYDLKQMEAKGASADEKKKVLGISNSYVINRLSSNQKKFSESELKHLLKKAGDYEEDFKSGRIKETVALELLLNESIKNPAPE